MLLLRLSIKSHILQHDRKMHFDYRTANVENFGKMLQIYYSITFGIGQLSALSFGLAVRLRVLITPRSSVAVMV